MLLLSADACGALACRQCCSFALVCTSYECQGNIHKSDNVGIRRRSIGYMVGSSLQHADGDR